MMSRRLIFLAHAVAPGVAGAEALVNAELLRALAEHWPPAGVTVISGGGVPALADGTPVSALPGWRVHALGECGASAPRPSPLSLLAAAGLRQIRRGGPASVPARLVERGLFWRTGLGMKAVAWSRAASGVLREELAADPGALVYSRALPFASILAADTVRRERRFLWVVNINDPLPPEVWPGQYAVAPWANRKLRQGMAAALPGVDGFTFPSEQLRDLEASAFREISRLPSEIVRHVAGRSGSAAPAAGGEAGTLRFAFAGTLRRDRCRNELREALALLGARLPGAAAGIEVAFYLPHRMPAVTDYAASLPVRTRVAVGLKDADLDGELGRADVLLNLESEVDRPLLMTKLASYSAFGKPVWSLCASGGTTWQLLGDTWGYRSVLGEPETALEALVRIHGDWQGGRLHERAPSPAVAGLFSPRRQVEALLRLVERIS